MRGGRGPEGTWWHCAQRARGRRGRVRCAGPTALKGGGGGDRARATHRPSPALWPYLLWPYLLWATVPAQLGCLVEVAKLEVVLYPRDAPRGLGLGVFTASASHLIRVRVRV